MKRQLTQREIDGYFETTGGHNDIPPEDLTAVPFDFRRLDRIAKSQLSALHFLHEAFVRNLSASLSVYLRSYVSGNLISVEQLPYSDFVDSLPSPTCMVYLSMHPYDGHSLVEVNQSLLSSILDLVLGGSGKIKTDLAREITDVEEGMLEGFFRIVSHDLMETWKPVVPVSFAIDSFETKPHLSRRIARNEAVVAIAVELRVGESVGMVNLAIPSITLKMMRQRFDQQGVVHGQSSGDLECAIKRRLARGLIVTVDCELHGATLRIRDLLELKAGNVIDLGVPFDEGEAVLVNGRMKYRGKLTANGTRSSVVIESAEERERGGLSPE